MHTNKKLPVVATNLANDTKLNKLIIQPFEPICSKKQNKFSNTYQYNAEK